MEDTEGNDHHLHSLKYFNECKCINYWVFSSQEYFASVLL